MADYRETKTSYTEKLSVGILSKLGIDAKRNNLYDKTAVDLILESKIKMDVQYSQNFATWGDFRLDLVSAYTKEPIPASHLPLQILRAFESRFGYRIQKVGKYFQPGYLDAVIVLFYDHKLDISRPAHYPDYILIVTKKDLISYIDKNEKSLIHTVKLNDKNGLGDTHGSAFLPINVHRLQRQTDCHFGTIEDLKSRSSEIRSYLGL